MNKSILLLFLVVGILPATAKERSPQEMIQAARTVLIRQAEHNQQRAAANIQLDVIQRSTQLTIIGGTAGFAVVANDDDFAPILGYSDKEYISNNVSPEFLWWLDAMNEQLEYNLANGIKTSHVRPVGPQFASKVEPLMVTEWGQNAPYYNQTPTYTNGKTELHYVTGCVATAMSQIMYYHKWPEKGKGTISYYFTPEGSTAQTKLTVNLAASPYDWNNMLPVYKGVNYNQAQADAVSTLMKHCGYAVKMQYTTTGSGAFTSDAAKALGKYFYYNPNMHFYRRDFFPVEEWMEKIFNELNEGNPVLYGANKGSSGSGHEFVFDGYDENGLVHVNWGWDGNQNGHFDIASLNGYTQGQEMVLIRKNTDEVPFQSYWGMSGDLSVTSPSTTTIRASFNAYNLDYNTFKGKVGLLLCNLATNEIAVLETEDIESEYLYGGNFSFSGINLAEQSDGNYRLYAGSFSTNGAKTDIEWQPIRCFETYNNSYLVDIANGKVSIKEEDNANWTSTAIELNSFEALDSSSPVRYYDLQGREVDASAHGVLIMKQGNKTRKVVR